MSEGGFTSRGGDKGHEPSRDRHLDEQRRIPSQIGRPAGSWDRASENFYDWLTRDREDRIISNSPQAGMARVVAQRKAAGAHIERVYGDEMRAFAANGHTYQRKANGAPQPNAPAEEVAVSQPGDPAEKEADAVADHVADKLHSGAAHGKEEEHAPDAKQSAPAIGAKLQPGALHLAPKSVAAGAARAPAPSLGAASTGTARLATPADVRRFCAPDPIATRKLDDVDAETNVDPAAGGNAVAKQDFYAKVMSHINANPATPANAVYNSCFNDAAASWKFKGQRIPPAAISRICSRTCSLTGWWWTAVDRAKLENDVRGGVGAGVDASKLAQDLWKARVKDGANVMSSINRSATIVPTGSGGKWFSPDKINVTTAGDAGFAQLMQINALQPEWFSEGTVSFELTPAAFQGDARKPTAYDGMQSAVWVSRPTGDTYGFTGGGAKEFLADGVKASGIVSAHARVPSNEMKAEIEAAVRQARDNALAKDPMLKHSLEHAKDSKMRAQFEAMIPSLTDQFIRGDVGFNIAKEIRNLLHDVTRSTDLERQQPTKNRNPSGTGRKP